VFVPSLYPLFPIIILTIPLAECFLVHRVPVDGSSTFSGLASMLSYLYRSWRELALQVRWTPEQMLVGILGVAQGLRGVPDPALGFTGGCG